MIESVLDQEKAISQVLKTDKKTRHLASSWQDLDVMESIKIALGPLRDFTDALSGFLETLFKTIFAVQTELQRAQRNHSRVYNPDSSTAVDAQAEPCSYDSPANHSSGGGARLNTGGENNPLPVTRFVPDTCRYDGERARAKSSSPASTFIATRARACFGELRAVSASRDLGALFREAKRERRKKWKHIDEL
ncbi:hypothetical protein SRHO_G00196260 [Serrasalmus rhombeus]